MNHPFLAAALNTVADSCRVARAVQQDLARVAEITKNDRSPVTVADFAVQAIVAMALAEADSGMLLIGEEKADLLRQDDQKAVRDEVVAAVRTVHPNATEDEVLDAIDRGGHDGSSDAYWALDPVDGTKGFLRGQQYAIALARMEGGEVVLGVMGCPNLPVAHDKPLDVADATGVIYAAVRGQGSAEFDAANPDAGGGKPINTQEVDGGTIRTCESVESAHSNQSASARLIESMGGSSAPVRLDSQCKYAVVARGQADAYLRLPTKKGYVEKVWDHAAGSLIAMEAGATVSDINGKPLDFAQGRQLEGNLGVICASRDIHGKLIETIAALKIGAPA